MVIYFKSEVVAPPWPIFMGLDKFENEDLIKYGFPEDVWFHVDKLSSAHVYLRLPRNCTLDDIPSQVLEDCAQLVKANSIQGNKMNNIEVVYTMWENLKKTADMVTGQVGFYNDKLVFKLKVEKRINTTVNRLNKTREEKDPDLKTEKENRDRAAIAERRNYEKEQRERNKEDEVRRREQDDLKQYKSLMTDQNMSSNKGADYDSDDFM